MESEQLVPCQKTSALIEEQKTWTFFQYRHSLEIIQTRLQVSSFQYGKSVPNQIIEAWWSILTCINYFKDLRESEVYEDCDFIHVKALKFYFYASLQEVLYDTTKYWNNHKIRKLQGAESDQA